MKTDKFPLTYFKNIWTPKRSFKGRHQLNWFQLIVVLLFLTSLLMVPVALNYAKMESYPIDESYPETFDLIDESVVAALQKTTIVNGMLQPQTEVNIETKNGNISIGSSEEQVKQKLEEKNALVFAKNEFYLKNEGVPISKVQYTKDVDLSNIQTIKEAKAELSRQWFIQNRGYVVGSLMLLVFSILFISTLFIVFGSAFFLYLTRKSSFSSIQTYKESLNVIENAMGLSTLVALVSAFIQFDIVVMLTIQSLGLVLMILMVFYQTKFNDKVSLENKKGIFGGKVND